jgi:hypothetical protein
MINGKAYHVSDDGTYTDITEGVQALYDLVISSMDWGSGFWSYEDALPVGAIAHLFNFESADEVDRYVNARKADEENSAFTIAHHNEIRARGGNPVGHDHVFNSAGRCMWPLCSVEEAK